MINRIVQLIMHTRKFFRQTPPHTAGFVISRGAAEEITG